MDKKMRSHRRSSSSSSTSSSASSFTSSSSSSSSFESRRPSSGRPRTGNYYKDQNRSKKSRPVKYSGSGDRSKPKKVKNSSSLMRKHSSSKSSTRKSHGHTSRKEYKDIVRDYPMKEQFLKDYDHSYKSRSPLHHHRRMGTTKKTESPVKRAFSPPIGRKSRKRSPSLHKKTHRRSISPRERIDYYNTLSPSRPRDPRIERAMKRSPEFSGRETRYSAYEREFEDRRREERENRDVKEKKLLKDRISFKDRFIATDRDGDRDEGRFSRDTGYSGGRNYEVERDCYQRVESRESSLERKSYDDPYERFERERNRIENRNRFEEMSHDRMTVTGDYPIDPRCDRRRPLPMDSRYAEERRKLSRDMWPDDPRNAGPSSSMMERLQEPESRAYSQQRRSGDWSIEGPGRRIHEPVGWDKHSPQKRRGPEWVDDYPSNEWRDRPREWDSAVESSGTDWHPRRYHNNWNEGERADWNSNAKKTAAVSPNVFVPVSNRPNTVKREPSVPIADIVVDIPTIEESFTKPEDKVFSPMSPSKPPEEVKSPVIKEEKTDDPVLPAVDLVVEKENFSDFSDDSDDILNQEPVHVPEAKIENINVEEHKLTPGDTTTYDEMLEEERMDLEEISDDDFEEEKQVKYSVANALDIDWSTLTVDPNQQPPTTRTSALKRFSTLNILSRLGVSSKYASKEFLDELVDKCYQLEIDGINSKHEPVSVEEPPAAEKPADEQPLIKTEQMEVVVKEEKEDDLEVNKEQEEQEENDGTVNNSSVPDDLPRIMPVVVDCGVLKHVRHAHLKRSRVFYLGRKALSSADDIIIRRRLCNLPEDEMLFEKPQFSKDLFLSTISLLK